MCSFQTRGATSGYMSEWVDLVGLGKELTQNYLSGINFVKGKSFETSGAMIRS